MSFCHSNKLSAGNASFKLCIAIIINWHIFKVILTRIACYLRQNTWINSRGWQWIVWTSRFQLCMHRIYHVHIYQVYQWQPRRIYSPHKNLLALGIRGSAPQICASLVIERWDQRKKGLSQSNLCIFSYRAMRSTKKGIVPEQFVYL